METTIRLLEDRVERLLGRLRELATDKSRLESEKRSIEARLDELETRTSSAGEAWRVPPDRVASALREAIRELKES